MAATCLTISDYESLYEIFAAAGMPDAYFLDSSLVNRYGRYAILGLYPKLRAEERNGVLYVNGSKREGNLLSFLQHYLREHREENPTELPMTSGAIGYFSYDYGRTFEQIPSSHPDLLDMPDALWVFFDLYLIEDLAAHRLYLCTQEALHTADWYLDQTIAWIRQGRDGGRASESSCNQKQNCATVESESHTARSDFEKEEYKQTITQMIGHICAGDIYIANMTRQIFSESGRDTLAVFHDLRRDNPSPFGAYLGDPEFQIVCASPERFLEVRNGTVQTRPIKGTRRRGYTEEEDIRLRRELETSEKDRSELLMIVDLERNDLSRVCIPGSVRVTELFETEAYATVFHLVSTIQGTLKETCDVTDLIRAAFPGGSITGAPKIRAMELIDALEHSRRGLYTGSIGYLSLNGDCDLNIVIRTAIHQNGLWHLGVGGGITAESEPEFEFEETCQKARAVLEAIEGRTRQWEIGTT